MSASDASGAIPPDTADGDSFAAALRGFDPIGIVAMIVVLALGATLGPLRSLPVLAWAVLSRTPWRELGFVRPRNWFVTATVGILSGVAFKLIMKTIVLPLLGADSINHTYHFLVGNRAALPGILLSVTVGAAFGEELLFRGYLFERLGRLLGSGVAAQITIVLITSMLFALAHLPDQGVTGAEQAIISGLVFGTVYARTRQIWLPMIAHAAFDVAAVFIIYWNLETRLAHLFIR